VIFGLGGIGSRLAKLAKAFVMRVIGIKRDPSKGYEAADTVFATGEFKTVLPQADFTALTCPLTKETENVIDADALSRMKRSAYLISAARGRCVDEPALIKALRDTTIAGAGIDVTVEEPLSASSPLWDFPNVLITPHTAGETRRYEENALNILLDNLERQWRGELTLHNQIV
jgi:phosphoglycerate dehydrogenase-like enzyme